MQPESRNMQSSKADSFPVGVEQHLGTYVYRLIDPRNGETFYVGKGNGDRVFAHARAELGSDGNEIGDKLKRIRGIRLAGFDVAHVIHRHGMDDMTAREVEAALIDAYPGLTNIANATGDRGVAHAAEIVRRYSAAPAMFQHKALLITVNRSAPDRSLYDATRYAWKVDRRHVEQTEVILAVQRGLIVGAFVAHDWLEATAVNFPGLSNGDRPGRLGFIGTEASEDIRTLYVGKRVPDEYRKQGAANPIRYTWQARGGANKKGS